MREPPLASRGEERQDVERPQRTGPLRRVVVAVDRGEGLGQGIHISNGDQPVPNVVGPLLGAERILEHHPGIVPGTCWPALRFMPMTMEPRPKVQPVPRKRRSTDSHGDLSLISLPRPSLARIGAERGHRHPQRLAHPTGWALRPKHRVAESSPALLQPPHVVGRSEVRNQLVVELLDAIWQVRARGGGGEEKDSGLHGGARLSLILIARIHPPSRLLRRDADRIALRTPPDDGR